MHVGMLDIQNLIAPGAAMPGAETGDSLAGEGGFSRTMGSVFQQVTEGQQSTESNVQQAPAAIPVEQIDALQASLEALVAKLSKLQESRAELPEKASETLEQLTETLQAVVDQLETVKGEFAARSGKEMPLETLMKRVETKLAELADTTVNLEEIAIDAERLLSQAGVAELETPLEDVRDVVAALVASIVNPRQEGAQKSLKELRGASTAAVRPEVSAIKTDLLALITEAKQGQGKAAQPAASEAPVQDAVTKVNAESGKALPTFDKLTDALPLPKDLVPSAMRPVAQAVKNEVIQPEASMLDAIADDVDVESFANKLAQLSDSANGKTNAMQNWVSKVSTPVNHQRWGEQVSERVVWMTKNDTQAAKLRLTPEHLGPMEIDLDIADEKATVNFTVTHATTKEALDSALPRLREMLAQQGIDLVDVNVSERENKDQAANEQQQGRGDQNNQALAGDQTGEDDNLDQVQAIKVSDRILDHYA